MAARVFLLCPEFTQVGDAAKMVSVEGGSISPATISKVIATLDSDLVIEREVSAATKPKGVRLLQPEKLLDLLAKNFAPPEITRTFTGKIDLPAEKFREALREWRENTGGRIRDRGEFRRGVRGDAERRPPGVLLQRRREPDFLTRRRGVGDGGAGAPSHFGPREGSGREGLVKANRRGSFPASLRTTKYASQLTA